MHVVSEVRKFFFADERSKFSNKLSNTLQIFRRVRTNLNALANYGLADISGIHFSENSGTLNTVRRIEFA